MILYFREAVNDPDIAILHLRFSEVQQIAQY